MSIKSKTNKSYLTGKIRDKSPKCRFCQKYIRKSKGTLCSGCSNALIKNNLKAIIDIYLYRKSMIASREYWANKCKGKGEK